MSIRRKLPIAGILALAAVLAASATTSAHEQRDVAGYSMVVGFIDEPVFTGQKSGLEFQVTQAEQPITGLEETLQAQAIYQGQTRDLALSARFGEDGWYESVFFPTAAGVYTFRIFGTINGTSIDETFTAGEETFSVVEDVQSGQFPVVLAPAAEVAADAERGAQVADQMPIALGLGSAGIVAGLTAIGIALARGRQHRSA